MVEARFDALRDLDMDQVLQGAHPEQLSWAAQGRILNSFEYRDGMHAWADGKESWRGDWVETQV